MRVLLDTCVVLDYLLAREPFFDDALNLCITAANRELDIFITAASVTDLYYLARKDLRDEEKVRKLFGKLFSLFDVIDITGDDCRQALSSQMNDYEDAVQEEAARRSRMDGIVTRNGRDYFNSRIPVFTPGELLDHLGKG